LQSAPQIRMIQDVNQTLAEKIQSSILTSIPLWKNQMAIAMSLLHQQKASKAQQQVTNTTNELLLKNSEMLKMNTIRTAEENERGIVELETLKITQQNIVDTIRETMHIQAEGKEKRRNAEIELSKMEQDLKTQLLQLQQEQNQRY
ncbi:MAG: toxic anion resistance protein, partial [Macrococcoides caseolyticum]